MTQQEDLMSFLESASRHSPVNQERLAETAREETRQEVEEQIAGVEERLNESQPSTAEEHSSAPYNEELIRTAIENLGLSSTYTVFVDTSASTNQSVIIEDTYTPPQEVIDDFRRVVEEYVHADEPELDEPLQEQEESIPEMERPVEVLTKPAVREELVRFSDADWFGKIQEKVIVLAGVGGIGSNMAVILAKLNPSAIYIFDDDTVESFNLAGQFYSNEDIGKPKVEALAASVRKYTNYSSIFALNRRFAPGEEIVSDIMVCGFDNMRARRNFFAAWKNHVDQLYDEEKKNCLYIDGRLTADLFQIFCICGTDTFYMEEYANKYLFNDFEAEREVCSYKQTGFLADMIGAFMVNLIVNFCANQVNPKRNMSLPFMTSYRSSIMFLDFKK